MTDRDLLELIARQVAKITENVDKITENVDKITENVDKIAEDVGELKVGQKNLEARQLNLEMKIEHDIKAKMDILFDGYEQTRQQLNRIEKEVSKHEEIILRSIR